MAAPWSNEVAVAEQAPGSQGLASTAPVVLGLDGGGSATRWCLMRAADAAVVAHGQGPPLGSVAGLSPEPGAQGWEAVEHSLAFIAASLPQAPRALVAGVAGYDPKAVTGLEPRLANAFGLRAVRVNSMSDIELLVRAHCKPAQGLVLYAGTGTVAAHLAADGQLMRVGGRGPVIDDAGGGYWIAAKALQVIWRAEDEAPGTAQHTPLGRALFSRMGGSDWADTRRWVATATRGRIGQLALPVAAAAESDPRAMAVLLHAGQELGRLAKAMLKRMQGHPAGQTVFLAGRVFSLHPCIAQELTAALPLGTATRRLEEPPHLGAARLAIALRRALHERTWRHLRGQQTILLGSDPAALQAAPLDAELHAHSGAKFALDEPPH